MIHWIILRYTGYNKFTVSYQIALCYNAIIGTILQFIVLHYNTLYYITDP